MMQLLINRFSLVFTLSMLIIALGVISPGSTLHADTSTVCPVGDFNGDLELGPAPCVINGHVNGNIKHVGSDAAPSILTIRGSVDGNIEQIGRGRVDVHGTVNGNIKDDGRGGINLLGKASVNGNLEEKDDGRVFIDTDAFVNGNVKEEDGGDCTVLGTVEGNLEGDCSP